MKNVLITTLGCKVNQYESAAFQTSFSEAGFDVISSGSGADIVVINTCAVTAKAGAQSRQTVRQLIRTNPAARIIITGCYAEIAADQLCQLEELAGREFSIIGNSKKDQLVANAINYDEFLQQVILGTIDSASEICRLPVRRFGERTRAYLRVQDGCESFCTYCIVPYTRGPSRSLPLQEVIQQASVFEQEGYREIVLTGIHLGNYGRDLSPTHDITTLLDRLTAATPDIRYRISSLEPTEISSSLLQLMQARTNIMPHFHIPLQSGADTILTRMNRKYTTAEFREVINNCVDAFPRCGLGIDILAGFPGETEQHFEQTYEFLSQLNCTYLHVFPYSRRPGTKAADFKEEVSKNEKLRRVKSLRRLGQTKRDQFHTDQIGTTVPVLVEGKRDSNGLLKGFSDNYIPVCFAGGEHFKNRIVQVKLSHLNGANVTGEVISNDES